MMTSTATDSPVRVPHLIDTHCHLDVEEFDADRVAVLHRALEAGVQTIVIPAIHAAGWPRLLALCEGSDALLSSLGLHPVYVSQHRDEHVVDLEAAVALHRPHAIGEIGLDFLLKELDPARQIVLFEAQLGIAKAAGLPVLLHVRKAHDTVLSILRRARVTGGIAHAFNGSLDQAKRYIDLGFKLGFGGMLTYERSRKLRALARELPLDALVLETDAPDLTPAQHRGERNSPEYLPLVLQALAEVRGESPDRIAERTTANARAVFQPAC